MNFIPHYLLFPLCLYVYMWVCVCVGRGGVFVLSAGNEDVLELIRVMSADPECLKGHVWRSGSCRHVRHVSRPGLWSVAGCVCVFVCMFVLHSSYKWSSTKQMLCVCIGITRTGLVSQIRWWCQKTACSAHGLEPLVWCEWACLQNGHWQENSQWTHIHQVYIFHAKMSIKSQYRRESQKFRHPLWINRFSFFLSFVFFNIKNLSWSAFVILCIITVVKPFIFFHRTPALPWHSTTDDHRH